MTLIEVYIQTLENYPIGQNTGYDYAKASILFVVLLIILKLFQVVILAKLKKLAEKTKTDFDDVLIKIFTGIKPPFYFYIAFYFGIKALVLPDIASQIISILFIVVVVYEVIRAIEKIIDFSVDKYLKKTQAVDTDINHTQSMMRTAKVILKVILWLLGITMILSNLGVNVTSIIASLGIGGIAIALALQNVLSDIFSSFSIYLDKPFQVGDFIVVGTEMGKVEKIGIKSTRLRSPQGEEIIMSNQELTSARVQNFKRMERRRALFMLGVVYSTGREKLERIPKIIEEIVTKEEKADFDRCHFKEYGNSSLNFEVVYYAKTSDYKEYMDVRHAINSMIYQKFGEEGIEFAFPTQTLFLNK